MPIKRLFLVKTAVFCGNVKCVIELDKLFKIKCIRSEIERRLNLSKVSHFNDLWQSKKKSKLIKFLKIFSCVIEVVRFI